MSNPNAKFWKLAEDEGVEPTDRLRGQGLANLCLSRSAYPPQSKSNYIRFAV